MGSIRKQWATALAAGFAIIALASMLAACQAMTGRTAGENVDDSTLTASVKSQLGASNLLRIDVDSNGGVVSLNGTVDTPAEKARAEQLARRVDGVKKVVNNLQGAKRS
jgi:osmotically-inducible protein OsmY